MIKTVVGSYPVVTREPEHLWEKILDILGLYDRYKYAIERAVKDQLRAGIDIVSDGQVRGDMIEIFVNGLYGFQGKRVVGKIEFLEPITLKDIKFVREILSRYSGNKGVKGIITGPCTIAASVKVEDYYSDNRDETLIYDLANALKREAESIQNYVSMIQIDEPILSTGLYDLDTARRAIKRICENIKVPVVLHVCGDVSDISQELNTFKVDILDHEFASNRKNLDILEGISKRIGFGCINTRVKWVESVDDVKDLLHEALEILRNNPLFSDVRGREDLLERLEKYMMVDPDCGMRPLPVDVAYEKLRVMVKASEEFERELRERV
ncbi:methionine synthase [Methanothermococcus sp. SCGC AD-155-E23]|nr:methionine synthase [Methanothermococcus sp. SCGC AD-155-E23]